MKKCLTEEEEKKIERLVLLLKFLNKNKSINFVGTGPFRFEPETESFYDHLTDRIVPPNENMIDLFYGRLCRDAANQLKANLHRSSMSGLRRLLIHFNKLDFLPIAL